MSMPKGFKSENGYASSKMLGGKTYHQISKIMIDYGYKMNHSTVRNIFISSLKKIAFEITALYGLKLSEQEIKKIAIDPRFQDAVRQFMSETNYERTISNKI
jgi:hypothetical protein